jgi:hypothetical protein
LILNLFVCLCLEGSTSLDFHGCTLKKTLVSLSFCFSSLTPNPPFWSLFTFPYCRTATVTAAAPHLAAATLATDRRPSAHVRPRVTVRVTARGLLLATAPAPRASLRVAKRKGVRRKQQGGKLRAAWRLPGAALGTQVRDT